MVCLGGLLHTVARFCKTTDAPGTTAPLWSVTRPLIAPVNTTFWALSNAQLANTTKTLHAARRLATGSILSLGRMTDCLLILLPEHNECSVKTWRSIHLTQRCRIQQESWTDFRITATMV
jgi:hypothetical protein